jgi:flagellar basal body-associated protein FliL
MASSTPLLPKTGKPGDAAGDDGAPAKKSKKKLIIIVLVLAIVLAGVYETVLKKPAAAKLGKDGKPIKVVAAKAIGGDTIELDPVTTSISDGHVIQIALGLRLVKGADAKLIATEAPQAYDAALRVLSAYTFKVLLSPTGREKALKKVKAAVIKEVVSDSGKQQVFDVYLPTYVLQ